MKLTPEQKEQILKELKDKGKCNINSLVTISIRPARKGKINGSFGQTPKYTHRPFFLASRTFKEEVNKL
jgi:hypothetical protein